MFDKRLETFVTVADTGSFSKAAEILYLSVPAVSKQITALEKDYELTLFYRGSHGSRLTKAGLSLYNDAKELIALSSSALTRASLADNDDPRTMLRIGNELLAPAGDLRPYLICSELSEKYKLQVYSFTNDLNQSNFLYQKIGASLDGMGSLLSQYLLSMNLLLLPLHKIPVGIFLPIHHPLASKDTIQVSDLNDLPMIIPSSRSPFLEEINSYFKKQLSRQRIIRPDFFYSVDAFNECAARQLPLVAPAIWDGIHPGLIFRPIDWPFECTYSFVYAKEPSPAVAEFVRDLREARNELAKTDPSVCHD